MAIEAKFTVYLSIMIEPDVKARMQEIADTGKVSLGEVARSVINEGMAVLEARLASDQ